MPNYNILGLQNNGAQYAVELSVVHLINAYHMKRNWWVIIIKLDYNLQTRTGPVITMCTIILCQLWHEPITKCSQRCQCNSLQHQYSNQSIQWPTLCIFVYILDNYSAAFFWKLSGYYESERDIAWITTEFVISY